MAWEMFSFLSTELSYAILPLSTSLGWVIRSWLSGAEIQCCVLHIPLANLPLHLNYTSNLCFQLVPRIHRSQCAHSGEDLQKLVPDESITIVSVVNFDSKWAYYYRLRWEFEAIEIIRAIFTTYLRLIRARSPTHLPTNFPAM
ncbi:Uncharacterized protein HZ326_14647 [Fusarium oxysporum f. sp. albedinis]|nr:Uncharacterized protein HZ326_14647 [Fusarium oxysporum f. sp. albedinis]